MTSIQVEAPVLRNEQITPDIYRLTLEAPAITERSNPGQFVMVKGADNNGLPLLRRPFSIHQSSSDGKLQILFKKLGPGTSFLARKKAGEILSLVGPLGKGFSISDLPEHVCVIGGGMGMAPLFYLTKQLLRNPTTKNCQIKVLLGATTGHEINTIESDFKNLGVEVHVSTDDGSAGHHGLVTDLLASKLNQDKKWSVLTCGPYPMMNGVVEFCRRKAWPCQVSMETLMACGISACLGCAVQAAAQNNNPQEPYLHVCKDGPVFRAEELEWI